MSRNRFIFFLFQVFRIGSGFTISGQRRCCYRYPRLATNVVALLQRYHDNSDSNNIPTTCKHSYFEFQYLPSNVTVCLVGCLHGSCSSANDVYEALCRKNTDAVVLELCPARYKILIKNRQKSSNTGIVSLSNSQRLRSLGKETWGLSATLLGGLSALQASLSGFQPGLEFTTAIDFTTTNAVQGKLCNLILADQAVDITLARIDALPKVSYEMFHNFYSNQFRWNQSSYDVQSKALLEAIWGALDLGRVLTRSIHAFMDLIKLTLPPVIVLQTLLLVVSTFLGTALGDTSGVLPMKYNTIEEAAELLMHIALSATIVYSTFILIVLPLVQVVIYERDDQIASGIAATCQLLRQQQSHISYVDEHKPRVVAVLGLLHVNGVAKRLMESSDL